MTVPSTDPFAGSEKNPSLAFPTVGTTHEGIIAEPPTLLQGRDFETGELAFWPDGNPKMVVLTTLSINGEKFSLWAAKPSALFAALGAARPANGFEVGGRLKVTYTGDKANPDKPRLNPQKQYAATYQAPAPADPFNGPPSGAFPGFAPENGLNPPPAPAPSPAPPSPGVGAMTAEREAQLRAMGFDPAEVAKTLQGAAPPF